MKSEAPRTPRSQGLKPLHLAVIAIVIIAFLLMASLWGFHPTQTQIFTTEISRRFSLDTGNTKPNYTASSSSPPPPPSVPLCSPTPWLLNDTDTALPYEGLHDDLPALLRTQSRRYGAHDVVSLVFFNVHQSVLMQNCVYSLVKFGGVCNYVVVTWDGPTLKACRAMHLPCYDAEALIPGNGSIGAEHEAKLHSMDYNKITWMKPIMVYEVLRLGYAVHATDVDIAYSKADLMTSYMKFIDDANATAAFQMENKFPYIVNTGNYMVYPTKEGIRLIKSWVERADDAIAAFNHEQHALGELYHETNGTVFEVCSTPAQCSAALEKTQADSPRAALVRRSGNPWWAVYGDSCITKEPHKMFAVHPCSFPHLYLHAVCVIGSAPKVRALKGAGFWFVDDGDDGWGCDSEEGDPPIVRCRPLAWRRPEVEEDFSQCDGSRLAFTYYQTHPAAAAEMLSTTIPPPPPPPPAAKSPPPPALHDAEERKEVDYSSDEKSKNSAQRGNDDEKSKTQRRRRRRVRRAATN